MAPEGQESLTGSVAGAPATHTTAVSIALDRLRTSVGLCCWIVATTLILQLVIWGLTCFTEMRFSEIPASEGETPIVVTAQVEPEVTTRSAFDADETVDSSQPPADPNLVPSRFDRVFATLATLARGIGTTASMLIVPLIGLGVLLAASSATRGVEKAVSAFGWALVLQLMMLPIGSLIGLPWEDGALWSYQALTAGLDRPGDTGVLNAELGPRMIFFARHLLLPLVCVTGVAIVGLRFAAGVAAGAARKEDLSLDGTLECETANIKVGSLHGGRAANAMRVAGSAIASTVGVGASPTGAAKPAPGEPVQPVTIKTAPGEPIPPVKRIQPPEQEPPPRRLI